MQQQREQPRRSPRTRRIAGRAQLDSPSDPYQLHRKLREGTVCPQCGAVYHGGRWQWSPRPQTALEALCAACRRSNDRLPAGLVILKGAVAQERKDEIIRLARHQEEAEKAEHPLNRIMTITEDAQGITIATTDIHLPRRIGEALARAFGGVPDIDFEEEGYFVRVTWSGAG